VKRAAVLLIMVVAGQLTLSGQTGLRVDVDRGLVSVEGQRVVLATLLAELDERAGTSSTIPAMFGGRRVSVSFRELPLDQAIDRVFEGLGLDYAVVEGRQIVVLSESLEASTAARMNASVQTAAESRRPDPRTAVSPVRGQPNDAVFDEEERRQVLRPQRTFSSPFGGVPGSDPTAGLEPTFGNAGSSPVRSIFANAPSILDLDQLRLPPGQARPLPGIPVGPPISSRQQP
jgi:hypothetical protein